MLFFQKKPQPDAGDRTRAELVAQLREAEAQLRRNESLFNMLVDFDMTEANIYERNAIQARYRHYLSRIRALDRQQGASQEEKTAPIAAR